MAYSGHLVIGTVSSGVQPHLNCQLIPDEASAMILNHFINTDRKADFGNVTKFFNKKWVILIDYFMDLSNL